MTQLLDLWAFEGAWDLQRVVHHADGRQDRLTGQAVFTRAGPGLEYVETGQMHLAQGGVVQARRRYLWRSTGDQIEVLFDDGRPFHSFSTAQPNATHLCPPDTYKVCYDLGDWPRWQTTWTVTGPRKSYRMHSRYGRGAC